MILTETKIGVETLTMETNHNVKVVVNQIIMQETIGIGLIKCLYPL